jgi:hypothetical protein
MPAAVAAAVAIHVESEVSPDLLEATVRSCDVALGADHCRLSDGPPEDDVFYATVRIDEPSGDTAHITVQRHAAGPLLTERDLAFTSEDSPAERWASVGVVIAALVADRARVEKPPPPAPPKPPPPVPRHLRHLTPPPKPAHPVRIDLLGRVSHATSFEFPPELGGMLRGSLALDGSPFFVTLGGGYAVRVGRKTSLSFPLARLGAGFRWGVPDARWAAELRVAGILERWLVAASEPGRSESGDVWRVGVSAGLDGIWGFSRSWQLVAGAEAEFRTPRVTIDVAGKTYEQVPVAGWAIALGPRFVP